MTKKLTKLLVTLIFLGLSGFVGKDDKSIEAVKSVLIDS
jgi:hypothetical protein